MTKKHTDDTIKRDDDAMERLLKLSGPRDNVPEAAAERVYAAVSREWQESTRAPDEAAAYATVQRAWARSAGRRRFSTGWLMSAGLLAASIVVAALVLRTPESATAIPPAGTVAKLVGTSTLSGLAEGDAVTVGTRLATGTGEGASIALERGESLRLDEDTTLVARTGNEFRLVTGRIYVDSGDFVFNERGLVIEAAGSRVTDVGTQFVVRVEPELLDVAVREGRVDVTRADREWVAVAGERLVLSADGSADVSSVAASDGVWAWTAELAPTFITEGRSLLDLLRWVARETGRELVFDDNETRMDAMRIDLHGSVDGFSPLEALDSMITGTRLHYRIEGTRIVVER